MPAGTVALVLVAAVAHAVWNTVSKYKQGDTVVFVWAYTGAMALVCVPVGLVPVLTGSQPLTWSLLAASLVSAVLHMAYSMILQTGYDRFALGIVYPVARGTGPLLTMLFAVLLLAERPGVTVALGAVAVVAGILVVAGNPGRTDGDRPVRGVLWGAATGATIAGYTLWDDHSVTTLHLAPVTYFLGTYLVQSLLLTPGALRRREHVPGSLRLDRWPVLAVAVLSPLAYILVLTAMQSAPVALVAPLRESSIVVGSLLAWRLFGEGHLARKLAGTAIVLAGIAAICI
ncbi:DMT family transporter [Pseudonocardia kujensis]|uniref:DMT family transporter n=1 Tax=Pseudonocardia kujensis TaxID=1128675 RepID=UPI001E43F80E|nr:DMT family transporter [Pseudonocardia kujensis]MCE0765088.1 DMT family transporter [Pseudonocardia kujensis]